MNKNKFNCFICCLLFVFFCLSFCWSLLCAVFFFFYFSMWLPRVCHRCTWSSVSQAEQLSRRWISLSRNPNLCAHSRSRGVCDHQHSVGCTCFLCETNLRALQCLKVQLAELCHRRHRRRRLRPRILLCRRLTPIAAPSFWTLWRGSSIWASR